MKRNWIALGVALALLLSLATGVAAEPMQTAIVNLKTEGRTDPFGVDTGTPAFSWQMRSPRVGAGQSAYRIEVFDAAGATVWDSGSVSSDQSVGVRYEGAALEPSSDYTWRVTVTDSFGETTQSDVARFTTSLLSDSFDAWDGAKWIGANRLPLDAASKAVFHISASVTLQEGSNAFSFVLGADDFRLNNPVYNPGLLAGENYVRVEVDFADATPAGGAKINAYRKGYAQGEDGTAPFCVISENELLDSVLNSDNQFEAHAVDIFCTASTLTLTIDGVELTTDAISVNSWGTPNTYPNLNSVGFAMNPGEKAAFENYAISNGGRFARGTLLDATTGAGYAIFEGLEGLTVDGGRILADGGAQGLIAYADPSCDGAPMLRRTFEVEKAPERAILYVTAQGIYNLVLNGEALDGDAYFNPGSTEYDALMGYAMIDVTDRIAIGENVLQAVLGEGWWTGMATFECLNNNYYGDQPALMAKLVLESEAGSETIVTDEDWQVCADGPVRLASLFQGERYDATRESDECIWTPASVIKTRKQFANPRLVTRWDEPVHAIYTVQAAQALGEVREGSGAFLYDMGENLVGIPEITIPAEYASEGDTLTIRYAEILYPELEEYISQGVNGLLMVENLRTALATDFYTMKAGDQTFCPDLTFHGYRYIEITGLARPLPAECVGMRVLSSLDATATCETSNPLVNRLFANIVNSTTGNYLSIPTDCPQRDERMGWTGDAQVYALSASYVADTYNFMRQWMDTVRADCGETGLSSQYCPAFVNYDIENDDAVAHKGQSFGITWNCLVVTIPYNLYLQTGNAAIVEDNIDNIVTYVDHLTDTPLKYKNADGEKVEDARLTGETGTLCDHLARIPTDGVSLGNAVYIACLDEAALMCDAVDRSEKAAQYREAAATAREAWNELFIDPETGKTRNAKGVIQDTQASYATPLRFNVISEANLPLALEHYRASIVEPNLTDSDGLDVPPYSITTGFNATGNVLCALCANGLTDVACALFESTEYASWLYPVTQGATSVWERWNGYTEALGFNGNNSMNSFNHYSFGAVFEWMMAYQLGICADPAQPGYGHFILQPTAGGTFTYARGSYDSVYGAIESGWTAQDGVLTGYECTVPANTTATLYLPVVGSVSMNATFEGAAPAVVGETQHNGAACTQIELPSGSYRFDVTGEGIELSVLNA